MSAPDPSGRSSFRSDGEARRVRRVPGFGRSDGPRQSARSQFLTQPLRPAGKSCSLTSQSTVRERVEPVSPNVHPRGHPKAALKDDRRDEMRAEIAGVAARLFAQRGYAATTMADIAEPLGVTKAALYYYVASKEEILGIIADHALGLLESGLERIRSEHDTYTAQLRAAIRHHVEVATHDTKSLFVLEAIKSELSDEQQQALRQRSRGYRLKLAALIVDGQQDGEMRADLDPHMAALAVIGMCSWVAWWFDPGGAADPRRIAEVFEQVCLGGLLEPDNRSVRVVAGSGRSPDPAGPELHHPFRPVVHGKG